MVVDPVNVVLVFFGMLFCPRLTLGMILVMLGHPILAVVALLFSWIRFTVQRKEKKYYSSDYRNDHWSVTP